MDSTPKAISLDSKTFCFVDIIENNRRCRITGPGLSHSQLRRYDHAHPVVTVVRSRE